MTRAFLLLRAAFFLVLIPGTVTIYVPRVILRGAREVPRIQASVSSFGAALLIAVGALVLLSSVWQFALRGLGTLAPIDPPRILVVHGLYRFTRNPMYNGVLAVLFGQAWLFASRSLLAYACAALALFHLMVILYEEPALSSRFGEPYAAYCRAVPRWGFTWHPYTNGSGGGAA